MAQVTLDVQAKISLVSIDMTGATPQLYAEGLLVDTVRGTTLRGIPRVNLTSQLTGAQVAQLQALATAIQSWADSRMATILAGGA